MIRFVFFVTLMRYCGLLNHFSFVSSLTCSLASPEGLGSTGYGPPAVFPSHLPLTAYYDQLAGKILQRYTLLKCVQNSLNSIHQLPSFLNW